MYVYIDFQSHRYHCEITLISLVINRNMFFDKSIKQLDSQVVESDGHRKFTIRTHHSLVFGHGTRENPRSFLLLSKSNYLIYIFNLQVSFVRTN